MSHNVLDRSAPAVAADLLAADTLMRNSRGTGKRMVALGLVSIEVPTDDDLYALGDRLQHHGLAQRDDGRVLGFDDPWLNRIEVTSKAGR